VTRIYGDNPAEAMGIFRAVNNFPETSLQVALRRCLLFVYLIMSQASANSGAGSSPTIFVVDDEPMLLDLAAAILQPLGFDVRTFRDPKAALKEFIANQPALLVTDYAMGEMNGLDLVRECRRVRPSQKIMLLSGTVDENVYANSTAKPNRFLAKPYQVRDFIEAVTTLAGR
jgi:CheY-like chemotaxis protein